MAFGKGRMGNTGGFFRHRLDDVRVERHERRPSAEWVKARQRVESALCHTLLPRSISRRRKCSLNIFTTEIFFVVNWQKKPLVSPMMQAPTSISSPVTLFI